MIANEKVVTLIRLRDLLYFGVRPTLRECGFSSAIIQGLFKEHLLKLSDQKFGTDSDRCVIEEILPAGYSFITQQHALRERHNFSELNYAAAG